MLVSVTIAHLLKCYTCLRVLIGIMMPCFFMLNLSYAQFLSFMFWFGVYACWARCSFWYWQEFFYFIRSRCCYIFIQNSRYNTDLLCCSFVDVSKVPRACNGFTIFLYKQYRNEGDHLVLYEYPQLMSMQKNNIGMKVINSWVSRTYTSLI